MKKIKHTPEQIVSKLRTVKMLVAQGSSVAQAVKQIAVSEPTYYRWRNKYGGMNRKRPNISRS